MIYPQEIILSNCCGEVIKDHDVFGNCEKCGNPVRYANIKQTDEMIAWHKWRREKAEKAAKRFKFPSVDEVLKMDVIMITRWTLNDAWWLLNYEEYWEKNKRLRK